MSFNVGKVTSSAIILQTGYLYHFRVDVSLLLEHPLPDVQRFASPMVASPSNLLPCTYGTDAEQRLFDNDSLDYHARGISEKRLYTLNLLLKRLPACNTLWNFDCMFYTGHCFKKSLYLEKLLCIHRFNESS